MQKTYGICWENLEIARQFWGSCILRIFVCQECTTGTIGEMFFSRWELLFGSNVRLVLSTLKDLAEVGLVTRHYFDDLVQMFFLKTATKSIQWDWFQFRLKSLKAIPLMNWKGTVGLWIVMAQFNGLHVVTVECNLLSDTFFSRN